MNLFGQMRDHLVCRRVQPQIVVPMAAADQVCHKDRIIRAKHRQNKKKRLLGPNRWRAPLEPFFLVDPICQSGRRTFFFEVDTEIYGF